MCVCRHCGTVYIRRFVQLSSAKFYFSTLLKCCHAAVACVLRCQSGYAGFDESLKAMSGTSGQTGIDLYSAGTSSLVKIEYVIVDTTNRYGNPATWTFYVRTGDTSKFGTYPDTNGYRDNCKVFSPSLTEGQQKAVFTGSNFRLSCRTIWGAHYAYQTVAATYQYVCMVPRPSS